MTFIILNTLGTTPRPITVRIDTIEIIMRVPDGTGTRIYVTNRDSPVHVVETFEVITHTLEVNSRQTNKVRYIRPIIPKA